MTEQNRENYAQAITDPNPAWPSHVRPISLEGLDLLGVDKDRNLYWNGEKIRTQSQFDLTWGQRILAMLTAVGAFASGAVAALNYFCISLF